MRKKAERKIREAAALLGDFKVYRLDKIRQKAGLYPKVFDKTILDMARVRTITLKSGNTEGMSSAEVDSLIRRGETLYVYFSFVNAETEHEEREPSAAKPSTINIQLSGLNPEEWEQFETHCLNREGRSPAQKIQEMIRGYNRGSDN